MHTLFEIISDYCGANGHIPPNARQIRHISSAIISEIRIKGMESMIGKKEITQPMIVNVYPSEIRPQIEQVLKEYFTDRQKFMLARSGVVGTKNFLYTVEIRKSEAFENALIKCGFPVKQNEGFNGNTLYQYVIPVSNVGALVNLGKEFQRQRWQQETRIAIAKWRDKVKAPKSQNDK